MGLLRTSKRLHLSGTIWQSLGIFCPLSLLALFGSNPAEASLTCFATSDPPPGSVLSCVAIGPRSEVKRSFRLPPGAAILPGSPPTMGTEWTSWIDLGRRFYSRGVQSSLSCVNTHEAQFDCFGVSAEGFLLATYHARYAIPSIRSQWLRLGDAPADGTYSSTVPISGDPSCLAASTGPTVRCFVKSNGGELSLYSYQLIGGTERQDVSRRQEGRWVWIGTPRAGYTTLASLRTSPSCIAVGEDAWCFGGTSVGLIYRRLPRALGRQLISPGSIIENLRGPWRTVRWSSLGDPRVLPTKLKCVSTRVGGLYRERNGSGATEIACFFPNSGSTNLAIFNTTPTRPDDVDGLSYEIIDAPSLAPGVQECSYASDGVLTCFSNRTTDMASPGLRAVTFPVNYRPGSSELRTWSLGGAGRPSVISCAQTLLRGRPTLDCIASEVGIRSRMTNLRMDRGEWAVVTDSIPGSPGGPAPSGEFQLCDPMRLARGEC